MGSFLIGVPAMLDAQEELAIEVVLGERRIVGGRGEWEGEREWSCLRSSSRCS